MPKKSIEINPFDGGLNDYADPRDIKENELAAATNIKTDQPGRIKIGKRIHTVSERESEDAVISIGSGLFHYNSDFNTSHAAGNTEYQIMYQASTLYRRSTGDTDFSSILDGSAYDPCFFSLDGNVRISDGAHTSDTKFIGVTDVNYFGQAEANQFTIKNAYIDAPTAGSLTKDPATPANAVTVNNALALIVQQKTGSKDDWFTFNQNDNTDTVLTEIVNQYSSDNDSDMNQSEYDSDSTYVLSSDSTYSPTVSAVSGQMYKAIKGAGSNANAVDYNRVKLRFASTKNYEDKSIFISLYFPATIKNSLKTGAIKIRVGNYIAAEGTLGNTCYVYEIGSDQIESDDWTVLELVHGQHDSVEGTPNASGIDNIQIVTEFQGTSSGMNYYIDNLQIGESSRGLWNGRYKFFQSWIYDKIQESSTYEYSGQSSPYEVEDKILQFRVHGIESANIGTNNRITGANIYYVEYDIDNNPLDTDKKLLMEVDLERGVKKVGGETWEAWGDANGTGTGYETPYNSGHTNYLQIMDPPVLETFSTKAGYDEEDKLKKMKYKTAVTMNRRSYVGNVKVTDSADKDTIHSDRVYKSEPNMPDIYTENGYVDVAINDGESVTALASFGDMLLQFKERTLYLINCTQEIEYLEDTSKFRGVWGQGAVCETDEGIVWVNKYGLFLFNGKEIIPLIDNKIDPENWNTVIGSKPLVGYAPLDRSVLVVGDADNASKGYTFSMRSKGFTHITGASGGNLFADDMTNLVSSNAGVLSWYDASGAQDHVTEKKWDNAARDVYIDIKSRDQDFKDPARRKMVKNVYLTYKVPSLTMSGTLTNNSGNVDVTSTANIVVGMTVSGTNVPENTVVASITDADTFVMNNNAVADGAQTLTISGLVPTVKYRTNGTSTDYSFNSALAATDSAGSWYTKVLKPNTSSEANNVYSFQVRMYGNADKDFEINDINVVYRDKVLK
tara:strand:+ start:3072 stop:5936 length:2865 start_codon:yes stop_codon:yes gene_type:complete